MPTAPNSPNHYRPADHPVHLPWVSDILGNYKAKKHVERDGKSEEAFHKDLAVEAFGEDYMAKLLENQKGFQGDWFQLAFLLMCHRTKIEKQGIDEDLRCFCPFCLADWGDIHLEHAILTNAHLEGINLRHAYLEHAILTNAHLEGALIRDAHLEHAGLGCARLENASLANSCLDNANFGYAHLKNARLANAYCRNTNFFNANFTGAKLGNANLDGADVRDAKGIVFDSNHVAQIRIEGNAPDPWSVLRRNYTGPNFFFHLLFLMAFFLPFFSKAIVLTGISETMYLIDKKGQPASSRIADSTDYQTPPHSTVDKVTINLESNLESFPRSQEIVETQHKQLSSKIDALTPISTYFSQLQQWWNDQYMNRKTAAWTLVGYGNNNFGTFTFFLVTLMMIFYNIVRLILTKEISFLRDAEERSKITPSRKEYMGETCQEFDSQSFSVVFLAALKLWVPAFISWRKNIITSWGKALHFSLRKLWDAEVWVWKQRKNGFFYIGTVTVVIVYAGFCYLDVFFLWLLNLICLVGVVGGIFGIVKHKDKNEIKWIDFSSNLLPPSPIKYLGLYRVHQVAMVLMFIGYGALVFQICRWLWCTQIPTY